MGTREGELFKDKIEVSLDGRQIFCLFCGGAVIASLVFVLGVMVGRRVEARMAPERAAAGTPSSDPLAALDQLAADGDADTASDGQVPSALREGQAAAPSPVDVSLSQPAAKPEQKPEAAAAPAPVAAKPPEPPKPEPAAKVEPPKPEPPKPELPKAEPPKPAAGGRFTLQLSSFQSRAEADAFTAELKKSGYAPSVAEANVPGKGTWFRVRLGGYASMDEAMAAKAEFESKQKIIAYVTRVK